MIKLFASHTLNVGSSFGELRIAWPWILKGVFSKCGFSVVPIAHSADADQACTV